MNIVALCTHLPLDHVLVLLECAPNVIITHSSAFDFGLESVLQEVELRIKYLSGRLLLLMDSCLIVDGSLGHAFEPPNIGIALVLDVPHHMFKIVLQFGDSLDSLDIHIDVLLEDAFELAPLRIDDLMQLALLAAQLRVHHGLQFLQLVLNTLFAVLELSKSLANLVHLIQVLEG